MLPTESGGTTRPDPGADRTRLSYEWLDRTLLLWEKRWSPLLLGLALSVLLMAAACLYVSPAVRCTSLGAEYAGLSRHPFAGPIDSPVGYRRLVPVIAYCLGLRGNGIIIINLAFALLLLWSVYAWGRRHLPRPGDAFFAAAIVAFSMVTLVTVYFGGYCDSLNYLLIFLMWRARKKPLIVYALLLLGLLNHESIAFLLPWFIYLGISEQAHRGRALLVQALAAGAAMALYAGYRSLLAQPGPSAMTVGYYLGPLSKDIFCWVRPAVANWGVGLFSVYKLFWILPILGVVAAHRARDGRLIRSMALLLLCAAGQLLIAYDSSRLLSLAYLVTPMSLAYLLADDHFQIRRWLGWLLLANLAVPQIHTASRIVGIMYSPWSLALGRLCRTVIGLGSP